MKELYLAIIERFLNDTLKQQFRDAGFKPIRHINIYAGQEFEENADAYLKPALFLKWEIDYTPDIPEATITMKIIYENLRSTSSQSKTTEKALIFIDFIDAIDNELKQIQTAYTSILTLNNEAFNIDPAPLDTYTLVYNCNYTKKYKTYKVPYESGEIENTDFTANLAERLA